MRRRWCSDWASDSSNRKCVVTLMPSIFLGIFLASRLNVLKLQQFCSTAHELQDHCAIPIAGTSSQTFSCIALPAGLNVISYIHQLNQPDERVDMIHDRVFNRMQHSNCTVSTATKSLTICRVTPWCSCSWRRFSSFLPLRPLLSCASGTGARSLDSDSRAPRLLQTTQMPVLAGPFLWKKGFWKHN